MSCPLLGHKAQVSQGSPGWAGTFFSSPLLVVALAKETTHRPEDTWVPSVAFEGLQDPKIPFDFFFFCPQLSQCSGHQTVNPSLNQAASAVPGGFPDELKLPQRWVKSSSSEGSTRAGRHCPLRESRCSKELHHEFHPAGVMWGCTQKARAP